MNNGRYDNEPLLRFKECWVLRVMGELNDDAAETCEEMTPHLRKHLGVPDGDAGDWWDLIEIEMNPPKNAVEDIKKAWADTRDQMLESTGAADPETFAQVVVDTNFR